MSSLPSAYSKSIHQYGLVTGSTYIDALQEKQKVFWLSQIPGHQISSNEYMNDETWRQWQWRPWDLQENSNKKKEASSLEDRANPVLDYPVISYTAIGQHFWPGFGFFTWKVKWYSTFSLPPLCAGKESLESAECNLVVSSGKGKEKVHPRLWGKLCCVSHTWTMADILKDTGKPFTRSKIEQRETKCIFLNMQNLKKTSWHVALLTLRLGTSMTLSVAVLCILGCSQQNLWLFI